ncbi:MAG TPA: hypothetical protein DCR40_01125 [Prolixibacteraceae bacterium]|nr:hypothetical protein [Prolixibacteraceae bacterium]
MVGFVTYKELIAENYNVLSQNSFWVRETRNSNAEVDYLLSNAGRFISIKVKSGAESIIW